MRTKEEQREYQRKWMAKRRADWFADKSCAACGSKEKLELDHVDPSTKVTHAVWSWSEARRTEELAKCQALCEDCHLEKTKEQLRRPIPHGSITGYKRGCRCGQCHQALLDWWRKRRANNGT